MILHLLGVEQERLKAEPLAWLGLLSASVCSALGTHCPQRAHPRGHALSSRASSEISTSQLLRFYTFTFVQVVVMGKQFLDFTQGFCQGDFKTHVSILLRWRASLFLSLGSLWNGLALWEDGTRLGSGFHCSVSLQLNKRRDAELCSSVKWCVEGSTRRGCFLFHEILYYSGSKSLLNCLVCFFSLSNRVVAHGSLATTVFGYSQMVYWPILFSCPEGSLKAACLRRS